MPNSANDTSILPFLKRQYPKGIAFTGYKKSKFLSMINKDTKFGGEGRHYVVSTAPNSGGGSADYQKAYSNQGPSSHERFLVTHRTEYQIVRIKGSAIAKTMGDANAVKSVVTDEFDKSGYAFGRAMAARAWAGGGGQIGQIKVGTNLAAAVITLAVKSDIVRFEKGMWIQFSSDDGTGTSPSGLRGSGTQLQVIKVNPALGQITVSANLNTVPGLVDSDRIFRAGDYAQVMTGVQGWVPFAAPGGADSFFGVNRSNHEFRLSGFRYTGTGSKENTLLDACAEGQMHGADGTACFMNPLDFNGLVKELGSDRFVDVETRTPGIGFKGIEIETAIGTVTCVSEVDVQKGNFWILNPDDFELITAGDCPRVLDFDGLGKMVRVQGDDAYQIDMGAYGNFGCKEPGHQIVGSFA